MDSFRQKDTTQQDGALADLSERQTRHRFAPLARLEDYWNALRGSALLPHRSEIDPRELKGTLEYCFVLERIAQGTARLRLAGSHLGDLMGMDVRGMPISSILTSNSQQEFGEMLQEVFETPAAASILLTAETRVGHPPLRARMILLPVLSDPGDTGRVVGALEAEGDIGRAPRRFDVDAIKLSPIVSRDMPELSTSSPRSADDERRRHAHELQDGPNRTKAAGQVCPLR